MPDQTWLVVLQGLLTPVIATIAVGIAYQQWKTNRAKLRLDLFERRMAIFREVGELIAIASGPDNFSSDVFLKFRRNTFEANIVFGHDKAIPDFIEELDRHAANLLSTNAQLRKITFPVPATTAHLLTDMQTDQRREQEWFRAQANVAFAKFRPFVTIA